MRTFLHLALATALLVLGAACDKKALKLDKKTERQLEKAAKSATKVAKAAGNELKKAADEAIKDAQKEKPVERKIPDLATSGGRGEVSVECQAIESAGGPIAVADENRWRANARCR